MSSYVRSNGSGDAGGASFKPNVSGPCYEFGSFRVDLSNCVLTKDGAEITLPCKAFDLLTVLIERRGQVVTRNELLEILWSDPIVEESNLTQTIYLLRKALGEGAEYKFIETLPKRGYRFNAKVSEVWPEACRAGARAESSPARAAESTPLDEHQTTAAGAPLTPEGARRPGRKFHAYALAAGLLAGLCLALVLLFGERGSGGNVTNLRAVKTLAILPFKNVGSNEQDAFLGLGLTDSLITKFSNSGQIEVRPTSAVYQYIGYAGDSLSLARALEVDAVLEGTVQKSEDRVRVTVRLLSTDGGQPLWGGQFDEQFTNVFEVQNEIAGQIAAVLRLKLSAGAQRRLARRPTNNPDAFDAYMRGLYFWGRRTPEGYKKSLAYFEEAIKRDSNYAAAYAALADTLMLIGYSKYEDILPHEEAFSRAKSAVGKALELDNTSAEAHTTLAFVQINYERDFQAAQKSLQTAIGLNPNFPTAHHRYGIFLTGAGRMEDALERLRRAQELDPVSAPINSSLAGAYYYAREYDQVIKYAHKALEIDPKYQPALVFLGLAQEQKGDYGEAVRVLEEAKALPMAHNRATTLQALGHAYAVSGDRRGALTILDEAKTDKSDTSPTLTEVIVLTGLGEKERALDLLESLFNQIRAPRQPTIFRFDPRFDPLRNEPRFQALMRRYNR